MVLEKVTPNDGNSWVCLAALILLKIFLKLYTFQLAGQEIPIKSELFGLSLKLFKLAALKLNSA